MVNNQERIQEIQKRIQTYFTEELYGSKLLAYQVSFLENFRSRWGKNISQEERLLLVKIILKENQERILEHTIFPPYCPTELQGLLQEWLIIQLETQFQAQIQQG